jgi:hypothetical protein
LFDGIRKNLIGGDKEEKNATEKMYVLIPATSTPKLGAVLQKGIKGC